MRSTFKVLFYLKRNKEQCKGQNENSKRREFG